MGFSTHPHCRLCEDEQVFGISLVAWSKEGQSATVSRKSGGTEPSESVPRCQLRARLEAVPSEECALRPANPGPAVGSLRGRNAGPSLFVSLECQVAPQVHGALVLGCSSGTRIQCVHTSCTRAFLALKPCEVMVVADTILVLLH